MIQTKSLPLKQLVQSWIIGSLVWESVEKQQQQNIAIREHCQVQQMNITVAA